MTIKAVGKSMALTLKAQGFKPVQECEAKIPGCVALLKRQTWASNRAVAMVYLAELPSDMDTYISQLRNRVAFKVGFLPLVWGLYLQVIIFCPKISEEALSPADYVAKLDNQWAIVQSVFLVDTVNKVFKEGRTWGQFLSSSYQDAISSELQAFYTKSDR